MKRMVDLPDDVKATFDGSSLQLVLHGAAPCPPLVKRALIDWWGPVISEYYGSTEGSVITMIDSEQWLAKGGSVGPPMPGMEVIVVGDDGTRLGPNEPARSTSAARWAWTSSTTTRRRRPPTCTSNRACSPPATSATSTTTGTSG